MTTDDAIREAAAKALGNYRAGWCSDHRECLIGMGDAVIAAVRPLIEAQLRERLAAAIDREWAEVQNLDKYDGGYRDGYLDGLERAENVVRSRP